MEKTKEYTSPYEMDGRIPWPKAIVYGLQHVLAMFVGNLTPLIVICGACGIGAASDFAEVYVELLQNAMIIAGVVTLVQLFAIGPVGGRVPIIMGTSSGFIGVFKSVAGVGCPPCRHCSVPAGPAGPGCCRSRLFHGPGS